LKPTLHHLTDVIETTVSVLFGVNFQKLIIQESGTIVHRRKKAVSTTIATALSVNNVPIRLTEERWLHIIRHHEELQPLQREVTLTVSTPDALYVSPPHIKPNYAAVKVFRKLREIGLAENLVVHYREVSPSDVFKLTALVISSERLTRRLRQWQRLR